MATYLAHVTYLIEIDETDETQVREQGFHALRRSSATEAGIPAMEVAGERTDVALGAALRYADTAAIDLGVPGARVREVRELKIQEH